VILEYLLILELLKLERKKHCAKESMQSLLCSQSFVKVDPMALEKSLWEEQSSFLKVKPKITIVNLI
jgi:hypothetical protein